MCSASCGFTGARPDDISGLLAAEFLRDRAGSHSSRKAAASSTAEEFPARRWLALGVAGLGMAAGNSPHALQNIASGGLEGLKFLESERQNLPEQRLKSAEATQAEATAARTIGAMNVAKSQQAAPPPPLPQTQNLHDNIDAIKSGIKAGGATQAPLPVSPGAVAATGVPAKAPTNGAAPPPPAPAAADSPDVQYAKQKLQQEYQLIPYAADPAAAMSTYVTRLQAMPGFRGSVADSEAAARLKHTSWDARAGSIHGVGDTPLFAVPTVRQVTDPVTGQPSEEYMTPPMPGQPGSTGAAPGGLSTSAAPQGNPQGTATGASWPTGVSLPVKEQIATEQEGFKEAKKEYGAAQSVQQRLGMMDHAIDLLNQSGWSSTGEGANMRLGAAKTLNSFASALGVSPIFDPAKVASWEDLNKETTRAGFELARSLGSREAVMVVQGATSAVPNAENTAMGAKLVSSSLNQASQRQVDYYQFLNDWGNQHGGRLNGADIAFNTQHPVQSYINSAILNAVPPQAVALLKSNPRLAPQFDQKYGTGIANFALSR